MVLGMCGRGAFRWTRFKISRCVLGTREATFVALYPEWDFRPGG